MCGRLCDELDPSTVKKLKENCVDYTCEKSNLAVWSSQAGACFACIRKADPTSSVLPRGSANTTAAANNMADTNAGAAAADTNAAANANARHVDPSPAPVLRLRLQLPAQMKVSGVVELLLHP